MSIIIFNHRRDLRINDNLSIFKCLSYNEKVIIIPVFFFDPNQILLNDNNKNYFGSKSAYFIIKSVIDLKLQYQNIGSDLLILFNEPYKCLTKIIKILQNKYNDKLIFSFNLDFSKFSLDRDSKLIDTAKKYNLQIITDDDHSDYCLQPWNTVKGYKQFGAYYKNALKTTPTESINYKSLYDRFIKKNIFEKLFNEIDYDVNKLLNPTLKIIDNGNQILQFNKSSDQWLNAGRKNCLKRLKKIINNLKSYNDNRDFLSYKTSNISAYLNIGTISIREIYSYFKQHLGLDTELIKQLYWRDFYLSAVKFLPNANEYFHMDSRYDNIEWASSLPKSHNKFKLMKEYWHIMMDGKTGFLLIDAGINELKKTGFLHGRNRMILGMFWTKYLLINPFDNEYGSQNYWSKLLVDAIGPSQNKMNHQWITEFDFPGRKFSPSNAPIAGRPMRIDNQQIKRFDPDCVYIKKWLPHLNNVDNKDIYKWSNEICNKYNNIHPPPIFNPKIKYKEWIQICTS